MINYNSDELAVTSLNDTSGFYKETVTAISLLSGALQTQKVMLIATSNAKVELLLKI